MLFGLLLNVIAFLLRYVLRVVVAIALIPVGVYFLLLKMFPEFCLEMDFFYWFVFSAISLTGFVVLWKPILWILGAITALEAGMD